MTHRGIVWYMTQSKAMEILQGIVPMPEDETVEHLFEVAHFQGVVLDPLPETPELW